MPVEVEKKLTHAQIREAKIEEMAGQIAFLEEQMLEHRNLMIEIRKELLKANKQISEFRGLWDLDEED